MKSLGFTSTLHSAHKNF
uniref:Uncharacterized protein n=1 Tax=Rhizophora mucronata TaxID=61149 RepID=A0A2P2Q246_RHIMU